MSYEPGRKDGYYYIWELMSDIEERQCRSCVWSKLVEEPKIEHSHEYPMCYQVEGEIVSENGPVEALDKTDEGVVVCVQYRNVDRALEARGQGSLFDEGLGSASS